MSAPRPPCPLPDLTQPQVIRESRDDGSFVLRSAAALRPSEPTVGAWLARWAEERPSRTFLAERDGSTWRTLSYAKAWTAARAIGQALVDRGLSLERPVAILSGNSIEHAMVALGAQSVGVPVVPVSVAYSTLSADYRLLRHVMERITPGLIFVAQRAPFRRALEAVAARGTELVVGNEEEAGDDATGLSALLATKPTASGVRATAAVTSDTIAKILMTSGSTGQPKGVLNTHGMLTANQQSLVQVWPFVVDSPPVLVDWLPWSHTFGGNHNFNLVLKTGGTMYIDAGRPAPGRFDETVRNLTEIAPTIQFNVPAGYAMLASALENDAALRENFFSRLQAIFYAAAALPQDTWSRLDAIAEQTTGRRVWLTTAWGSTETSPLATSAHFAADRAGNIGVPVPGVSLKFVPASDKLELRVKGPNVTPGYHRDEAQTSAAFDEEGFYRIGDAAKLVDPDRPSAGVMFDGRVSEDFKLATGTWVNVGRIRTEALSAAGGLLKAAVVTGHDRDAVGLLAWLDVVEARCVVATDGEPADLIRDPQVHAVLQARLNEYNQNAGGSSRRIARVMLLPNPPSLDAGEITDKGYVNAAAVLRHRDDLVGRLYQEHGANNVLVSMRPVKSRRPSNPSLASPRPLYHST